MRELDTLQVFVRDPDLGFLLPSSLGRWAELGRHHLLGVRGHPGLGARLAAFLRCGSQMDDVDDAFRLVAILFVILPASLDSIGSLFFNIVLRVYVLDEPFQMGFQAHAVFSFVPVLFVIGVVLSLVSGGRVASHRLRPFEEWFRLDLIQELIDWLLKDRTHSSVGVCAPLGFFLVYRGGSRDHRRS